MKYPRAARLTRRQDIDRLRKEGRTLKTTSLVARVSPSLFSYMRIGLVVPRFGQSAVDRNRLKRRLRELVRTQLLSRPLSMDAVIWAQRGAYQLDFSELRVALLSLADRMEEGAQQVT